MITINGEAKEGAGLNIEQLLEAEGFDKNRVAVGINDRIAPKDTYLITVLKDGDVVEVFHFMSGGCNE
jgi:thiamine biosynthesis protein ThiS